jgi:UDPglucose 6-dehydrogenase
MTAAAPLLPGVKMCSDAYAALEDADAAVLITEWNEFRALDLDRMHRSARGRCFVDLRHVYGAAEMAKAGFALTNLTGIAPVQR